MTTSSASVLTQISDQDEQVLLGNRWFASLSERQQHALLDASKRITLRQGHLFAANGQMARKRRDGLGVLVKGLLKVSSTSLDGRVALLGFVRPGQWFGELALLDGGSRERDFLSVGSSEILVIEPEALRQLLQDAMLGAQLSRLLASRTRALLMQVESFTLRPTLARTARRLAMLAFDDELVSDHSGAQHRATLDISQDELASMLGMTRQSVASHLRLLAERGAISQAYGRIHISSMEILMSEAA